MAVRVHGLDPMDGETAFAFFVVRLVEPVDRAGLADLHRYLAPLIPDADAFIAELPDPLDEPMRIVGMPWTPPEAGHAAVAQRRLIEGADAAGVEAAWFFQTGTSLPSVGDDKEDDDDDGDEPMFARRAMTRDDSWGSDDTSTTTHPISISVDDDLDLDDASGELDDAPRVIREPTEEEDDLEDVEDDGGDHDGADDDSAWSHGPPPQRTAVRFPVDGYPAILDDLDWEDFGIAFKLAGPHMPGTHTVLLGFHTLWLAPYGGRYRNAAVTLDPTRHAAHLWVDRFSVPCSPQEQVHHLLWILSKLDEVVPIVRARFGGASMAQKYGGLIGEAREPFVLGGNPLIAIHAQGGEAAVDAWIASQTDWSDREVAAMLRELAIEIVGAAVAQQEAQGGEEDEGDDDDDDDDFDDDDEDGDDEDDDESEGNEDEDRGRQVTIYAGELLRARAVAGTLDPRTAERLLPILGQPEKHEHRRCAVIEILGALRFKPAVPALIKILEDTTIKSSLDALGKQELVGATAAALGAIADPIAIPALARVVAAPGSHNDKPRPVAADALASCLAASPEPPAVDDAVLGGLLTTIRERKDGSLNAETHFAYGRIARQLPPARRDHARQRLLETDSARDDATAQLARQAALVLASPAVATAPRDLAPLLREALTALAYDHDDTVKNLRLALRVAEVTPELVDPADLVWLTRFAEPDIRARAHALLDQRGLPLPPAPAFDARAARAVDEAELVRLIGEPHVVGRAALIAEAGDRELETAHRAIIDACHDVISRARQGGANLLDPDTRILEAAVAVLREGELDADVIALFDRMLRHSNFHVKWELLQHPPADDRLIGGMSHVLGEHWGWQEKTAKEWLAQFQGPPDEHDEDEEDDDDVLPPDEEVN
jgi:hypothetical protein